MPRRLGSKVSKIRHSSSHTYAIRSLGKDDASFRDHTQHQTSITFTLLPNEVILLIGEFLDFRLGLPTGALDRQTASIFGTPNNIAVRAIAHYESLMEAIMQECWRSATEDHRVVKAICERGALLGPRNFNLDWTRPLRRHSWGQDGKIITPLRAAITAGNAAVVRYLLNQGATADLQNTANGEFSTPLVLACSRGHLEIVKMLLDRGADIHASEDQALRMASAFGRVPVVRLLLSKGANLEAGAEHHGTALCKAAESGHLEVVSELLSQGANIHASNDYALYVATDGGHVDVARVLLSNGADISVHSDQPICVAAEVGPMEMVTLLLDHGADINARNGEPLRSALGAGNWDITYILLQKGADVQLRENQALWIAVANGNTTFVELLLELGANPAAASQYKRDALKSAKSDGFKKAIELINRHIVRRSARLSGRKKS
ncbi:hypothetical protein HDU93_007581 [Gonapodya sp. JEL0774]|nr:hypothetical protein HDU93_007581 [Gonapodya sp. JEL0774]